MTARHDRYGDLLDEDDVPDAPHWCDHGWIDRDADHPRPCLICRPRFSRRQPRTPHPSPEVARRGIEAVRAALAEAKGHHR